MQDLMHYRHTYLAYCVDKKNENKQKEAGFGGPFLQDLMHLINLH